MKTVKGAVLRVRHDVLATDLTPTEPTDQDFEALFNSDEWSISSFWRQSSHGELDLQFTLMPWISVPLTSITGTPARAGQAQLAIDALRAQEGTSVLDGYGFLVVVYWPGVWNGGMSSTANGSASASGFGFSLVAGALNTRTFVQHEVGHPLGFPDGIGLSTGVGEEGRRYGDPYDIMSAETFAGRSSTWTIEPAIPNWPAAMSVSGPRASRAAFLARMPEALRRGVLRRGLPAAGETVDGLSLINSSRAAVAPTNGNTVAVLQQDPSSPTSEALCLELRTAEGFDRALTGEGNSPPGGLVIHRVGAVSGVGGLLHRYIATIPLSSADRDATVLIDGTTYTVRISDVASGAGSVTVSVQYGTGEPLVAVRAVARVIDYLEPPINLEETHDACGNPVRRGLWQTVTHSTYRVDAQGMESTAPDGQLSTEWRVDGKVILARPTQVQVQADGLLHTLLCKAGPGELHIDSTPGDAVTAAVTVTVTDATDRTASAGAVFHADGAYQGVYPHDLEIMGGCLDSLIPVEVERPPFITTLEHPDWLVRQPSSHQWRQRAIRDIEQTPGLSPEIVETLRQHIDLQLPLE
ncbi:hypothetical protein ACSBPH_09855 [Microbacterium sp. F51-2R]|uniref:hypothetical protein n=1 Tax=Microbacterium sp. F51-2R TaxID=3445777 RepID=UPI003F9F2C89